MPPLKNFAREGFTHFECHCLTSSVTKWRPLKWRPRISMGLTLARLSERLVRRDGSFRQAVADGKHARQAAGAEGLGSNPNGPIAD